MLLRELVGGMIEKVKRILFQSLSAVMQVRRSQSQTLLSLNKILVVQLQNLGDSMIFTPTLRALREAFPQARIDMLVHPISYEVFHHCPYVDRFWQLPSRRLYHLLRCLPQIRREHYDAVILDINHKAFLYNLIAFLTGAQKRIGFDWEGRGAWCTVRLPCPTDGSFVAANLALVEAISPQKRSRQYGLEFWVTESDCLWVAQTLRQFGVLDEDLLICVHPGSNWLSKRWFPDRFARVIEVLINNYHAKVVLTGTPSEVSLVEGIIREVRIPTSTATMLTSLVGKMTLGQLAALIQRANLLVTVDSGPQHLATALGTPMVLLMSAQDYRQRWAPPEDPKVLVLRHDPPCSPCLRSICPLPTHDCMAAISVEEVLSAIEQQLNRFSQKPSA